MKKFISIVLFIPLFFFVFQSVVYSDELDDLTKQINDLTASLNQSKAATAPLESQLKSFQAQIADIKAKVSLIEEDIEVKRKNIESGYKSLDKQQDIFERTVREFYINTYANSPVLLLVSAKSAADATQKLAYQKAKADSDKSIITNIALSIFDLETKKKNLESEEERLSVAKASLDKQSAELDKVVQGAKTYQAKLSSQIAQLSAQQQQLVAQKLGSLNIPRSAGTSARGCSDDRHIDPGFSPRIAFFSYGAPHQNGLNQYGAFGRAKGGQNEEQILSAYYPNMSLKKDYDQGAQVNVDGYGTFAIEDYVKRIWEVPNSWGDQGGMATLKAQAVAARTYALNSMQRNGHICTTESCQVFRPDPKGGNWENAVIATAGWVLMDGDKPGFSQYASTHGGYIQNLGKFDGSGGNPTSFTELNERAYDKESPWFYCDWGSRGDKKTAWLTPSEVADIANVILLVRKDQSKGCFVYQPDKAPPAPDASKGCPATGNWSPDKVKSELRSQGITPFDSTSDISVNADFGSGKASSVTISGQSFSGSEFKNWFNVRAPANLQIVSPLYNVEKQ